MRRWSMQKSLTDILVRTVAAGDSKRLDISDSRCDGLALRVTPTGFKTWSFRFRDPKTGKDVRSTIGRYPDVSLSQARERAIELRREVAKGINPVERKRKE